LGTGSHLTTHSHLAEVKERIELYIYSPSGLSWQFTGLTLPVLLFANLTLITTHIPKKYVAVVQLQIHISNTS